MMLHSAALLDDLALFSCTVSGVSLLITGREEDQDCRAARFSKGINDIMACKAKVPIASYNSFQQVLSLASKAEKHG